MRRATVALLHRLPHPAEAEGAESGRPDSSGNRPRERRARGAGRVMRGRARAKEAPDNSSNNNLRFAAPPAGANMEDAGPAPVQDAAVGAAGAAGSAGSVAGSAVVSAMTVVVAQSATIEQRVREAGGPIDNASYSCACGMVFAAAVSTTVSCPHCGAGQAW